MTARKKAAGTINRRVSKAKSLLSHVPGSGTRGGMSFRSLSQMTTARYIAGGLAVYGLYRLAKKLTATYPQIGEFFSDNVDTVEGKFREWTGKAEEITDSAH